MAKLETEIASIVKDDGADYVGIIRAELDSIWASLHLIAKHIDDGEV